MALTQEDLEVIASMVSAIVNERPIPISMEGRIVPGSYEPIDGTVQVQIGDSDAAYQLAQALGDSGDLTQMLAHPVMPLVGNDPNDQYGPRGGEPVVIENTQSGYVAKLRPDAGQVNNRPPGPGPFFSVQAPSGERWLCHRNASGDVDSAIKLTNDGPTEGDGLGGTRIGYKGALTKLLTNAGWTFVLDDTNKLGTLTSPNGVVIQVDDNNGKVYLGATGLGNSQGVVTKSDLNSAISALAAIVQGGPGVTAPSVTASTTIFATD